MGGGGVIGKVGGLWGFIGFKGRVGGRLRVL